MLVEEGSLIVWDSNFQELARDMAEDFLNENLPEAVFGAPKAGAGMWASCLRVMDPVSGAC